MNASGTTELAFADMRIPARWRLGEEGEGFKVAMATLDGGRIGIAAQAVGIAQGAFEEALAYSQQREQFNQQLCRTSRPSSSTWPTWRPRSTPAAC